MFETAVRHLSANRWVTFKHTVIFPAGLDFTDADFAMQVRDQRDTTVTPRADLATVGTQGDEGIYFVGFSDNLSSIEIVIDAATMQAMDTANDSGMNGDDGQAWFDLIVTPDGGTPFVALRGKFNIIAGATTT